MKSLRRFVWRLGRHIYCKARGEPASDEITIDGEADVQRRVIAAAAKNDSSLCVFDIGANKGDWTLPLIAALPPKLQSSERTRVHLVEPVPATRTRLASALSVARVEDLTVVHPVAVSDSNGRAVIHVVEEAGGRSSLVSGAAAVSSGDVDVETITLASLFEKLGVARAQLVKMDAEGHDLAILRGARDLLAAERIDVVQFEYNYTWVAARGFLKDVFDLIEGLPYRLGRVCPSHVDVFAEWHPELDRFFHANYLLIREPALDWFDVTRGEFDISNTYA